MRLSIIPRILLAAAILTLACEDAPATAALSTCTTIGPTVSILDNHLPSGGDHALEVPPEDVVAGVEKTYDIRGDNVGHTHSVTIEVAAFGLLQVGDPVTVLSSNNGPVGFGHTHTVQLTCPGA